jgi:hypothetical protein
VPGAKGGGLAPTPLCATPGVDAARSSAAAGSRATPLDVRTSTTAHPAARFDHRSTAPHHHRPCALPRARIPHPRPPPPTPPSSQRAPHTDARQAAREAAIAWYLARVRSSRHRSICCRSEDTACTSLTSFALERLALNAVAIVIVGATGAAARFSSGRTTQREYSGGSLWTDGRYMASLRWYSCWRPALQLS